MNIKQLIVDRERIDGTIEKSYFMVDEDTVHIPTTHGLGNDLWITFKAPEGYKHFVRVDGVVRILIAEDPLKVHKQVTELLDEKEK